MLIRLLFVFLGLVSFSAAESFDKPKYKKTVDLGPAPNHSHQHAKINCHFYPNFMVKEVDMAEKGAERLAIVPIKRGVAPRCTRVRARNEIVINSDEWSGYFKGVKGDLVFFDADDGWNGGLGFAVYDSKTGKKIFDDVAVGEVEFLSTQNNEVSLKYTRIIDAKCVLPRSPDACWAQVQKTTGLENIAAPDCEKGYEQSAHDLAKGRCQAQSSDTPQCFDKEIGLARDQTRNANSVIAYPVEVKLGSKPVITPMAGDVRCWPSD